MAIDNQNTRSIYLPRTVKYKSQNLKVCRAVDDEMWEYSIKKKLL